MSVEVRYVRGSLVSAQVWIGPAGTGRGPTFDGPEEA